jgi:uncharacterized protein YdeI (YjbR/CyaY-like superfamily)
VNIQRAKKLIKAGKMTAAGRAVFKPERKTLPPPRQFPPDPRRAFKKHATAWENFQHFPPFYRRMTIAWVASAKRTETRLKRLGQLVRHSAGKRRIKFI